MRKGTDEVMDAIKKRTDSWMQKEMDWRMDAGGKRKI